MNEDLIGIQETAEILGLSDQTVYHHIRNGNLPVVGRFGNSYILSKAAVEAFRDRREAKRSKQQ
jgi:excisionase family DNA binding protein